MQYVCIKVQICANACLISGQKEQKKTLKHFPQTPFKAQWQLYYMAGQNIIHAQDKIDNYEMYPS